jgi:enterochelin esterase-like enzyme
MFSLTGTPLFVATSVGAVLAVLAAALVALRPSDRPLGSRLLARALPVVVLAVVAQVLAMGALALKVNDEYVFFTSWADLTGGVSQGTAIRTGGLLGTGEGHLRVLTVHAHRTGRNDQVMVWLPPQYDLPAYRNHRFPVVLFLAGQPSTPQVAFRQFAFGHTALTAMREHLVPPFVAVFPTLMVAPPRDTECTNVPGGPQAETWLSHDVPSFVQQHYRVAPPGRAWSVMGWSTGGFCAAKLVTTQPGHFGSAVSFGGYYQPVQDHTTGSLFAGRLQLKQANSPAWRYRHLGGLRGSRLLLVAGRQDKETWRSTRAMLQTAAGDPAVSHIAFAQGGHNYRNYSAYLGPALRWSAGSWPRSGQ